MKEYGYEQCLRNICKAKSCWKSPLIIESHINGLRTKEYNPNIPVGYEEVAEEAIKCWEAGACGIHVHNTDMKLIGAEAFEDYMKVMGPAIKKYPDLFWYSTLSAVHEHGEEVSGLEHAELLCKNAEMKLAAWIRGRESPSLCGRQRASARGGLLCPLQQDQ
jgi:hypothetical protein